MVDWDTVFKRQRAIQGICGKTQPDSLEQKIQQMSHLTGEKVREIQKTKSHSSETTGSREVRPSNWLDSPNTTAEARLLRFDSEHPKMPPPPVQRKNSGTLIQWKAASRSVALFGESAGNEGEDHSTFLCQIPNEHSSHPVRLETAEIPVQEKSDRLIATPVSVHWPHACEKMRRDASVQIRQLADHLESIKSSGRNLLALCSREPGHGCTTILLVCARETSHRGLKTLLIDGNFANPSLAATFHLPVTSGWESLVEEEVGGETTLWSLGDHLDLLALDTASSGRAKTLFQDVGLSGWADVFRDHYDLVLIDGGSLSEQEDFAQLKRFGTDGVFLIVDSLEQSRESIERFRQSLTQHHITFLGLAENHVR